MRYAVIENNKVINVLIGKENQQIELEKITNHEVICPDRITLQIGDMRIGDLWTRNINGEQVELTPEPTVEELLAQITSLTQSTALADAALEEMGVQVYE